MSLRDRIVGALSPRVTTVTSDNEDSSAAASQRSGVSSQSMTTRSRSKAMGARQPRDSEGFESASENWEQLNLNEDGVNSEVDENLTDGEPRTNPGEGPPLTEDEQNVSEADEIEGSPKTLGEPPLNTLKHFTEDHCRAKFSITNPSTGVEDMLLCGKLVVSCKRHKAKRREGIIGEPGWYVRVMSNSKDPKTKEPIYHGEAEGYYCEDEKLVSRRQLDHIKTSDDEYGDDDSEGGTNSEGTNTDVGSEMSPDEHQSKMDELNLRLERLKLEHQLLELEAQKAALIKQSPSPIKLQKLPTKKTKTKAKATAQPEATPIARKKTGPKPPKQVTIAEANNTAKSPPLNQGTARILDPALAKTESTPFFDPQSFMDAWAQATAPLMTQMKATADTVAAAAENLRMSAQDNLRMSARTGAHHHNNMGTTAMGNAPPGTAPTSDTTGPPNPTAASLLYNGNTGPTVSPPQTTEASQETELKAPFHQKDWQLLSTDPSSGQKDKIFGMDITGNEIERAMMPEGLQAGQMKGMYDAMSDVTSLPGTCSATSAGGSNSEQVEVMERWFQSIHASQDITVISDTGWRGKKRHGLGTIANEEDLMEATNKTYRKSESVFENQRLLIHRYLRERGYLASSVDQYVNYGLLPRIIRDTYRAYCALLSKIREKRYELRDQEWDDSEASTMLKFYSEELWELRSESCDKRMWLFKSYIFLRDAFKRDFQVDKLTRKILDLNAEVNTRLMARLLKLEANQNGGGGKVKKPGDEALTTCPHCRCRGLHTFLKLEHTKAVCPIKDHAAAWSKKAAKVLDKKLRGGDKRPLAEVIKDVSDNWEAQE